MNCTQILHGTSVDCSPALGGVKQVYLANYADVESIQIADDKIVDIKMAADAKFYTYAFRRGQASFTSTLTVADGGASSVATDLNITFNKMETAKRVEMSALAVGELVGIVIDGNGTAFYLGKDFPITATAGTGETGATFSDANQYTITLQDVSLTFPYEVKIAQDTTRDSQYVDLKSLIAG